MTRRELNQYHMQERLAAFLNDNLAKIKDYPAIISGVHKLAVYNFDIYALTHTHRATSNSDGLEVDTEKIKQLFHGCRVLLNDYLDLLMLSFKVTNPQFYSEYQNARMISDQPVLYPTEAAAV